ALYFALSPALGDRDGAPRVHPAAMIFGVVPLVGFYDGVFGPGAGSFYMIGFVALLRYGAVKATAQTKLANFASNAASLATYALLGQIVWSLGLAMGLAQSAGSFVGARAAMRNGARLIRPLLVAACLAMAARLAWAGSPALRQILAGFWAV
ncbi:MAG: TSUP family transporter, partial [Methylobacteriaceae bacterium]|nr:TSUP family transporter [Methylobacteriaceae bacterium]